MFNLIIIIIRSKAPCLSTVVLHSLPQLFTIPCSFPSSAQAHIECTLVPLDDVRPRLSGTAAGSLPVTRQPREMTDRNALLFTSHSYGGSVAYW